MVGVEGVTNYTVGGPAKQRVEIETVFAQRLA
jgi:hypothetical protein